MVGRGVFHITKTSLMHVQDMCMYILQIIHLTLVISPILPVMESRWTLEETEMFATKMPTIDLVTKPAGGKMVSSETPVHDLQRKVDKLSPEEAKVITSKMPPLGLLRKPKEVSSETPANRKVRTLSLENAKMNVSRMPANGVLSTPETYTPNSSAFDGQREPKPLNHQNTWQAQHPQNNRHNQPYRNIGLNVKNKSYCTTPPSSDMGLDLLSPTIVHDVEKFVFFVGYPRSGHSIIGSVLDAHPDMVIAHEYFLFENCASMLKQRTNIFEDKVQLFNKLVTNSFLTSKCGWRSDTTTQKGYNFNINYTWQGRFNHLQVIGDKSGASVSTLLHEGVGKTCLQNMIGSLNMPVIAIHVVRNPYDMIATSTLFSFSRSFHKNSYKNLTLDSNMAHMLSISAKRVFAQADMILYLKSYAKTISNQSLTIMEIHIEDYIQSPPSVISELCKFLAVDCPQDYVDECSRKAFRKVSRSRDLIPWSPKMHDYIDRQMKKYPFFSGYILEDSFRKQDN